ncbi:hypothetical protein AB0383_20265 [Amycolatopsis sp. NPDC051373]|uniref:hypothetical protein n=1 Tax=Amycolatopsis sp. NPDC051373 TaxID=3155801 RepID=UPI00344F62B4
MSDQTPRVPDTDNAVASTTVYDHGGIRVEADPSFGAQVWSEISPGTWRQVFRTGRSSDTDKLNEIRAILDDYYDAGSDTGETDVARRVEALLGREPVSETPEAHAYSRGFTDGWDARDRPAAAPAKGNVDDAGPSWFYDPAAAPAEPKCTCFVTPESQWTTHYGAVEPGSQLEQNPDCPVHPAAAPAEPRCCIGPFADGRHALNCWQKCQDCRGDVAGPDRCRCNDEPDKYPLETR